MNEFKLIMKNELKNKFFKIFKWIDFYLYTCIWLFGVWRDNYIRPHFYFCFLNDENEN
jgi:hypothetical protein